MSTDNKTQETSQLKQMEMEVFIHTEFDLYCEDILKRVFAIQKEAEMKGRAEMERKAQMERELEMKRRAEMERELEMKRRAEMERKAEMERELEMKRRAEMERKAQMERELEMKRRAEMERELEMKRRAEMTKNVVMTKEKAHSIIREIFQKNSINTCNALRFTILWNDLGFHDENDLDAHCIEPSNNEIYYSNKKNDSTGGKLDFDNTHPKQGEPAVENITWTNINKMNDGEYRFFVHQYANRNGQSGFRAEIEFENRIYYYDYRAEIPNKSNVDVARVTLKNGRFSIQHCLQCST